MKRHRIMVIGSDVTSVQRVSRYCLEQGAEVFPYYGVPPQEDVALFAPQVLVLCLPMPFNLVYQMSQPHIFWSEQPVDMALGVASTLKELSARLQDVLRLHQ